MKAPRAELLCYAYEWAMKAPRAELLCYAYEWAMKAPRGVQLLRFASSFGFLGVVSFLLAVQPKAGSMSVRLISEQCRLKISVVASMTC
mmetsp:Transcript_94778/g.216845  ORF Transcript_94778/g.216845 Transcript_94778/m.216845 type:complete len:89 (-) Transcript_94778:11-277(-)